MSKKPVKKVLLTVIKIAQTYIELTLWQVNIAVNKCFMQTNLLYPYEDPRGDGLPFSPLDRGDNLPTAMWVKKWDLNPWHLAPEAITKVLHYNASHRVGWPGRWPSCQLSAKEDVREVFPFLKWAPRWENGSPSAQFSGSVQVYVLHPLRRLPETLKDENQATVDKNLSCIWNGCCASDKGLQPTPVHTQHSLGTQRSQRTLLCKNSPPKTQHSDLQMGKSCLTNVFI